LIPSGVTSANEFARHDSSTTNTQVSNGIEQQQELRKKININDEMRSHQLKSPQTLKALQPSHISLPSLPSNLTTTNTDHSQEPRRKLNDYPSTSQPLRASQSLKTSHVTLPSQPIQNSIDQHQEPRIVKKINLNDEMKNYNPNAKPSSNSTNDNAIEANKQERKDSKAADKTSKAAPISPRNKRIFILFLLAYFFSFFSPTNAIIKS
jgi:hypothetical protein